MNKTLNYFCENYTSNTLAGTSVQSYFTPQGKLAAYAFYKPFSAGEFDYSFLFTNTVDSTYSDGSLTKCNDPCGEWKIFDCKVIICNDVNAALNGSYDKSKEFVLTFGGSPEKKVLPNETFYTDSVKLNVTENEYICIKTVFEGKNIPCHIENKILTYSDDGNGVKADKYVPLPSMIGVKRHVKNKIAFWGDSITQGIGCKEDSYAHYTAVCAEILGNEYSFWNLGIGFGRAADAATNGAWADKVKTCDTVIVCFGVNDLYKIGDYEKIKTSYDRIIGILKGKRVIFQTIPPFDYPDNLCEIYLKLNDYIRKELSKKVYAVFDETPYLSDSENPFAAKYGGHPDEIGCKLWGERLADFLRDKI